MSKLALTAGARVVASPVVRSLGPKIAAALRSRAAKVGLVTAGIGGSSAVFEELIERAVGGDHEALTQALGHLAANNPARFATIRELALDSIGVNIGRIHESAISALMDEAVAVAAAIIESHDGMASQEFTADELAKSRYFGDLRALLTRHVSGNVQNVLEFQHVIQTLVRTDSSSIARVMRG